MEVYSILDDVEYNDKKVSASIIMQTAFTKEIRILIKKDQLMKEHKAPYPIVVEVVRGQIDFEVEGEHVMMSDGMMVTLDANVPHSLLGKSDSVVRLTLSKPDKIERVEKVATK